MERFVCIHGHFYQPPRENAWLEAIEQQDSAAPFHDWNERVTAECYAPNSASRILDGDGAIVEIVDNYTRISFDFGPTLLTWMQQHAPETYQKVLQADRSSAARFSGHGSAMAQAYNHVILPLANDRDRRTQVLWGLADFEHRFGRRAEGMWLPETAVDVPCLEALAEHGVKFTVLAPHQAARVREIGRAEWQQLDNGAIDPSMAYRVPLPSGRSIDVFFYDGPISRAVAFERLLSRGEDFVDRLLQAYDDRRTHPQLAHIATDGETYGHHHRHGDMALAFALRTFEAAAAPAPAPLAGPRDPSDAAAAPPDRGPHPGGPHASASAAAAARSSTLAGAPRVTLTNYGEYLARFPPTHEAGIVEGSSWSCPHGVERWRADCGCNTGGRPDWNQAWRGPLRAALDWLRDALAPAFEAAARQWLRDPWAARDDYVRVVLDRSPENVERFLARHATAPLDADAVVAVLELMELQRNAMLMYTSCGWFFDELSGIETVQVIQYAARALQLGERRLGLSLEEEFASRLAAAKSNLPDFGDGRRIYERLVRPLRVDLPRVAAHFAIASTFQRPAKVNTLYCWTVRLAQAQGFEAGKARLLVGRGTIESAITRETAEVAFWAFHLGDHNVQAGVGTPDDAEYEALLAACKEAFSRGDWPQLVRLMDRHFPHSTFSLRSLFRDEQRRVLGRIMEASLAGVEAEYRRLHEYHAPLLRFLADLAIPPPRAFQLAAELVIDTELRRALEQEEIDVPRVEALIEQARAENVPLHADELGHTLGRSLHRAATWLQADPFDLTLLRRLHDAAALARKLPFAVPLWSVQNVYYGMLHGPYRELRQRPTLPAGEAEEWLRTFAALGRELMVRVS